MKLDTKEDCLEVIKKMAGIGDELSESLELLENDDVIQAYLRRVNELHLPLWISRDDAQWNSDKIRLEWDEIIGQLQEAQIVCPFGEAAWTTDYEEEDINVTTNG
jgi:hypothetical protein